MQLAKYLNLLQHSERLLSEAFFLISDRHSHNTEVKETSLLLGHWSAQHAAALAPFLWRYGRRLSQEPERLRSALFHSPGVGGVGELRDLHDLALLAQQVRLCRLAVMQAAKARRDQS